MIKKRLAYIIAAALLFVSANGCDNGNDVSVSKNSSDVNTENKKTEAPDIEGYELLWHDEFEEEKLDETIWNYEPHEPGWTNEELQEYTTSTDNVFIRDGNLIIKAIDNNGYYTSGKITTQNKQDFLYGKVVARAKVPEGQGLWPAIWMMPKEESYYGQWPKCGEIDIMEVLGSQTDTAYGTVHYGEPHAEQQGTVVLDNGTFASDFHEYSVEWEPGEMRFYIDGNLYHTVNDWFTAENDVEKPYPAPFDQPFFVQMNLAVGGTWPGNPDDTTDFSKAEFEVDYVRVYQKPEYDTNVKKPEKVFRTATDDGNLIYNGNFDAESLDDEELWSFLLFEGGEATAEIKDNSLNIDITKFGSEQYSVQIVQPDVPCYNGHKYRLTFEACADENRAMYTCVTAPNAGWVRYLNEKVTKMTPEWQTYTYEYEMKYKDDNNGRLEFNMGNIPKATSIHIKNVRIEDITDTEINEEESADETSES